jgi:iron complex transport system ATP-binding protein
VSALLDIRNIEVFRGRTRVLDGFTLRIDEGCNTAILGPNGAGKSTLLKLVSGELHPVFSGDSHVKVFGKDRWNMWDLRSRLGIVSHDFQQEYLAGVTGTNVVLSGFYSSVDVWQHQTFSPEQRAKAEETIQMLGVGFLKERTFGSMSTGEQRRFLLARTLVNDPRVLLLDEPTSGLDIRTAFLYSEVLRELMRRGRTILLTTHHIHEIPPEVQRVVLLKNGRVFADGSREDVLTSEVLSALFEYPLQALSVNGTCQVFPARTAIPQSRG